MAVPELMKTLGSALMPQLTETLDVVVPTPIASASVGTPLPIEPPQSTPAPSTPATSTPTFPPFKLNYPASLPKKLCTRIAAQLKGVNLQDEVQRLLNYFADCLQKGGIRDPMAYFVSLKQRLLTGGLDFSEEQGMINRREKKQKTANYALIDQRLDYADALADYNQLKRTVEATMTRIQCTFETALKTMFYTAIWEKACQRLETLKKLLKIEETTANLGVMSG